MALRPSADKYRLCARASKSEAEAEKWHAGNRSTGPQNGACAGVGLEQDALQCSAAAGGARSSASGASSSHAGMLALWIETFGISGLINNLYQGAVHQLFEGVGVVAFFLCAFQGRTADRGVIRGMKKRGNLSPLPLSPTSEPTPDPVRAKVSGGRSAAVSTFTLFQRLLCVCLRLVAAVSVRACEECRHVEGWVPFKQLCTAACTRADGCLVIQTRWSEGSPLSSAAAYTVPESPPNRPFCRRFTAVCRRHGTPAGCRCTCERQSLHCGGAVSLRVPRTSTPQPPAAACMAALLSSVCARVVDGSTQWHGSLKFAVFRRFVPLFLCSGLCVCRTYVCYFFRGGGLHITVFSHVWMYGCVCT